MFGMHPPLRFMVARLLAEGRAGRLDDLLRSLEPLYGGEKQFTRRNLEEHLQALKAVGIVEVAETFRDSDGELAYGYRITDTGRKLMSRLART